MHSLEFEIHGKVQGVFFRKYTKKQADKLKLTGWVMNTKKGTVVGVANGPQSSINELEVWLKNTGSPKSRIDKADFKPTISIESSNFSCFSIRR